MRKPPLVILNMHFHHETAKRISGLKQGFKNVLGKMAEFIERHGVQMVIGDFNNAVEELPAFLKPLGVQLYVKGWNKWRPREGERVIPGEKWFDCLAIFFVAPYDEPCRPAMMKGHVHVSGAHYPLMLYVGHKPRRSWQARLRRQAKDVLRREALDKRREQKRRIAELLVPGKPAPRTPTKPPSWYLIPEDNAAGDFRDPAASGSSAFTAPAPQAPWS